MDISAGDKFGPNTRIFVIDDSTHVAVCLPKEVAAFIWTVDDSAKIRKSIEAIIVNNANEFESFVTGYRIAKQKPKKRKPKENDNPT